VHRPTETVLGHLPDHPEGRETVLKLFAFAQAYVGSTADSLRRHEEGQTMAEYGVVLAVITIAVIGAITLLSDNVRNAIENVAGIMPG
jgi:Flp pilus assembly pilin Flp